MQMSVITRSIGCASWISSAIRPLSASNTSSTSIPRYSILAHNPWRISCSSSTINTLCLISFSFPHDRQLYRKATSLIRSALNDNSVLFSACQFDSLIYVADSYIFLSLYRFCRIDKPDDLCDFFLIHTFPIILDPDIQPVFLLKCRDFQCSD